MRLSAIAATLALLVPAAASGAVYECHVNQGAMNGGWITDLYFFEHDQAAGSVLVYDGLIDHFNKGEPVEGTVSKATDAQLAFRWSVFVVDSLGQRTKLNFRGVLYFAKSEFSVQGEPVGYADRFNARGVCKIAE